MMANDTKDEPGTPPDDLVDLYLGLLKKGATWTPEATPEVEANQRAHLALLRRLSQSGDLLLAGPTPSDSDLRGILIINADSEQAAKHLFEADAHIASDRLVLELHPLLLSKANLTQPLVGS